MTGTIGFDTSFLIDFFKGEPSAISFIKDHSGLLKVSELVIYEFLCGNLSTKDKDIFLKAMQSFPSVSFNHEAALIASDIFREQKKKGTQVGHADSLIAGSYLAAGISQIVTRNIKHFNSFSEITVINY